jgi:ABC-type Mn2+/Zn2+ transport system permease subunit
MIGFSLLVAAFMVWLKEKTELLTDTIMALLLSGSVALGIIIISLLREYRGELHRYLFGDILAISWSEVGLATALLLGVVIWVFAQLNQIVLVTAQEEIAHVCGVNVRWMNYLFVLVLTLTVAMSIRLLGIILVTSLLVIPPAAARNVSRNLRQQMLGSVGIGMVGSVGGTLLASPLNVPCGPAIVMMCIAMFLLSLGVSRWRVLQSARNP